MKINPVGTMVTLALAECPRCKGVHHSMMASHFEETIVGGYTHFVMCPTFNKPVLIRVLGESLLHARVVEKLSR